MALNIADFAKYEGIDEDWLRGLTFKEFCRVLRDGGWRITGAGIIPHCPCNKCTEAGAPTHEIADDLREE